MTKRLSLFALKSDLLLVFKQLEDRASVVYTEAGSEATQILHQWSDASKIDGLGTANGEQTALCRSFLITKSQTVVVPRRIDQFDGKLRFDVDQMLNPDCIVFTPAGEWMQQMIIAGLFATLSSSPTAQKLMRLLVGALRKHFTKINTYWVGPEALVRLRSGFRLTMAEQSPPMHDLREKQNDKTA